MKKITLLIALIFGFIASSSAQFLENFDASTAIPVGWTVINQGGANTWNIGPPQGFSTPPPVAISGTNTARITYNATAHDDYLITPQLTPATGVNDRLSFWVKNYGPTYVEHYEVLISITDASSSANFSTVLQPDTAAPNAWGKVIIDLTPYIGQPIYIAFRALSTDQFYLCFDDIANDTAPSGPPNCDSVITTPANNASNANLSGNISWSFATGDPTGYKLTVGTTSGGSDVLPQTDVLNVTTYNVGALLPSTMYYVTITPYSTNGEATGCTEYIFTTFTPPANDDCSGAVVLTVNPALTCDVVTSGTVLGATGSSTSTTSCAGNEDDDVWFSFVAADTRHRIDLSNVVGSTTFMEHSVWEGADCDNLVLLAGTCSTSNNSVVSNLVVGNTYYFRVYSNTANVGQNTTFNICVATLPPPAIGSLCSNPIIVTLPYTTTDNTVNYEDANYEGSPGATGCNTTSPYLGGNDVVYAYTATSDTSINIDLDTAGTWSGLFIYTSCAAIGTGCVGGGANSGAGGVTINEFPVVNGQTYYFVISTWPAPQTLAYTLNILENTCTNATATYAIVSDCDIAPQFFVAVNVTSLGTATSLTISDNQGSATQNVSATGIANFGPYANATPVIFTVSNDQDATCILTSPAQNQLACPPVNDNCVGAIALSINPDLSCTDVTAGSVAGATASPTNATSCFGAEDDDVWFSFVATQTSHPISLLNVAGLTTDMFHSLWTGLDCDNLTLVPGTCSDADASSPIGLIVGNTYYLRVYTYTATVGQTSTFNVCIGTNPPPPSNDNLCQAILLTVGTSASGTEYNNYSCTAETSEPAPTCFNGGINGSVWFSFVAPPSGNVKVTTDIVGGTLIDTEIAVYNGTGVTCSNLTTLGTAIACDQDGGTVNGGDLSFSSIINIATLTPGNTYYVQVDRWGTASNGTFGLDIIDNNPNLASNTFEPSSIKVYPNPVIDILNLSYSNNIDKVQIVNLLGQEVVTKVINATDAKVDMSQLASGTYLVKVTSDSQVKTLKVIKQ